MPIPIIASDMMITSTSIVSHVGMRFAGWAIACPSAPRYVPEARAWLWTGSHVWTTAAIITIMRVNLRFRWSRDTGIAVVFRRWPRLQARPRCSELGSPRIRFSSKRSPDERSDIRGCGSSPQ